MDVLFLSYEEQVEKLREKNLLIDIDDQKILERENYFSIVNGYKQHFAARTEPFHFLPNTSFKELYTLYDLDRELRYIYLRKILKVEKTFASIIAYVFSKANSLDNSAYLLPDSFQKNRRTKTIRTKNKGKVEYKQVPMEYRVEKLLITLQKKVDESKDEFVVECIRMHHAVPLWILINTLTLGDLWWFYMFMKPEQQDEVAHFFTEAYEKEYGKKKKFVRDGIEVFLASVKGYRNICAHNDRFFSYKNNPGIANIGVLKQRLRDFLLKSDDQQLSDSIDIIFHRYRPYFKSIDFDKIKKIAGFIS